MNYLNKTSFVDVKVLVSAQNTVNVPANDLIIF